MLKVWYIGVPHAKNGSLNPRRAISFNKYEQARHVITDNYPFNKLESTSRSYTDKKRCNNSKRMVLSIGIVAIN